jgi:carboxyl-terminal processing protease
MDYTTPVAPSLNKPIDRDRRAWLRPAALGLAIGFACGFAAHALWGPKQATAEAFPDVHTVAEAIEEVRDNYVEPRDEAVLLDDAIRGVMNGLDEHSVFLDARALENLTEQTTGHFGGIGIEVTLDQGAFKIITPIDDTPAQRAGLNAGDELIRIDDTAVLGRTLDQVTDALRGEPGTVVRLAVHREGNDDLLDFAINRAAIDVDSVRGRMLEPGYGYLRIAQFQTGTGSELVKALKALQSASGPLLGLVLDLRNNPGGVLQASVDVADAFLSDADGLIVYTEGRQRSADLRYLATGTDLLNGAPLVVLINKGSASASEVVAGALQDHRRALVVGTTSYGKGSVQAVLTLDRHRALKLTTAHYFTPSGRSIQSTGIQPDVVVDPSDSTDPSVDPVLAEGVRQLKQTPHRT